jgi:hypothetical protein
MNVSQAYADDLDLHSFNLPSLLMAPPYLFTAGGVGLIQVAAIIGFCIALFLGGWLSDVITARQIIQAGGKVTPEQRLVSLIPFVWVTPVACILTGFAASRMWPWAGIAFSFGMREYPSDLPLFDTDELTRGWQFFTPVSFGTMYGPGIAITYVVSSFPRYDSQCLISINLFKNVLAFILLLEAFTWIQVQGFFKVYLTLMGIAVAVALPAIPLYYYGHAARTANYMKRLNSWFE